jgi:putative tryptophan/tyrosine transport system substrate-binding protein
MRRRTFIASGLSVLGSRSALSQAATRRLAILSPGFAASDPGLALFFRALRVIGYEPGGKMEVQMRFAEDRLDQLPALAAELVNTDPTVIYTWTTTAAVSVAAATKSIPVVVGPAGEEVMTRLAGDFSRPRGNVTGLVLSNVEQAAKCVELLKEAAPRVASTAVIVNPDNPSWREYPDVLKPFVEKLGVALGRADSRGLMDIEATLAGLGATGVDAVLVVDDSALTHEAVLRRITEFARFHRLPSASTRVGFAHAGGLLTLGTDILALRARAAWYVSRILDGVPPHDLPVERPTRFHLVLNMRVAREIGIEPPLAIQARADEVIE